MHLVLPAALFLVGSAAHQARAPLPVPPAHAPPIPLANWIESFPWVPDNWYPELTMSPGTPLGPCTYDAATETFAREWSSVSVSLDMNTETAEFKWKEGVQP